MYKTYVPVHDIINNIKNMHAEFIFIIFHLFFYYLLQDIFFICEFSNLYLLKIIKKSLDRYKSLDTIMIYKKKIK